MNKKNLLFILVAIILSTSVVAIIFIWQSQQDIGYESQKDLSVEQTKKKEENYSDKQKYQNDTDFKIGDTAQDKCYDSTNQVNCPDEGESFFGQDSQYLSNNPSYRDNGDGTITDLNTGLMWLKKVGEKQDYYDFDDSFSYAGYDDWRIPSIKELYTLMDFRGIDPDSQSTSETGLVPFIDTNYFDFEYGDVTSERIIDSQWVTRSIYVSKVMAGEECFFGVNFADGRIKCYPTRKGKTYFTRYVRGNFIDNEFLDNDDGTVLDRATGLIWQKGDSGKGIKWEEALNYCEGLELAENDDWRLPSAKELQYIVDYSRSPDTTNSPAINSIFKTSSIQNELGEKDYPYFWTSTTHVGHKNASSAVYISFGRALGYMNGRWMDVHGAGAQRSDPKTGDSGDYPNGFGPQGDARRIDNYARCVRGEAELVEVKSEEKRFNTVSSQQFQDKTPENTGKQNPPQEAIDACKDKTGYCFFVTPQGKLSGQCRDIGGKIACVPLENN